MASKSDTFMSGARVRREFIEFFAERGHTFVPSSSLIPLDDPTLLFANAGMNQFKDVFLGTGSRPYSRAVNTQKCIRAGGKHNDLEEVGHDDYHHTFFEMLGNWSFGDYFKAEAIAWAWELLTGRWGIRKDRLHATVFGGDKAEGLEADEEAAELWRTKTDIDPSHIHRGGKKDNFWEMAETGPCGPCSEIHIDFTQDGSGARLVNAGDPRVVEIWNLVFIQFNRGPDGRLSGLPARHVDTGMGFERVCRVLQSVDSNYATDVFRGLFAAIHKVTGAAAYAGRLDDMKDVAYRVVGDHARALTFALTDGGRPSNDGRGYVLRRILRRAARYGRQYLNTAGKEFLYRLAEPIVKDMGDAFPELAGNPKEVAEIIRDEEAGFNRTLDRGLALFEAEAARVETAGGKRISGQTAFELYATFGFPVDLTQLMARERGLSVDMDGYAQAMEAHRQTSAVGGAFRAVQVVGLPATDDAAKYGPLTTAATVLGWVEGEQYVAGGALEPPCEASLVLDKTNFYAEAGGQAGDAGTIETDSGRFVVQSTWRHGQAVLHAGKVVQGQIRPGQQARLTVDRGRVETMRNHTATHLLNWALREVLGQHIQQAGSVVAPDRLRFDFSHPKAVSAEQLEQVERLVNERVLADEPVAATVMPLEQAKKIPGVRAMFGEKYPDPVRVISIGATDPLGEATPATPVEFCGGTHLSRTGQVGLFKIVAEEAVAKGVRRITAVTGRAAVEEVQRMDRGLRAVVQALATSPEQAAQRVAAMQKELKTLRKKLQSGQAGGPSGGIDALLANAQTVGDTRLIVGELSAGSINQLRSAVDQLRQKAGQKVAIMVGWIDDGKVTLVASVSDAVIADKGLSAGDWVRQIAPLVGGGGGGKPQMAQAGGKEPDKLPAALQAAAQWAKERLEPRPEQE